jgi:uncharacterized protein (TIGR01777 family)
MGLELKTALVTGGTGFIGTVLCARLVQSGFKVYVLKRMESRPLHSHNNSIIYVNKLGVLDDIEIDVVINLAGEAISQRWTRKAKENIYNSRILTTRYAIDYMKSLKKRPQLFISGSAVGYYGVDSLKVFDEETGFSNDPKGFAQYLCQSWEAEARRAETLGVRVVLLRIGPVLEKNGGILSKLLPSFYLGLGSQIGNGSQWFSWIDRDDLIDLILFTISNTQIYGPINATAPNPVTNKDFSLALAKAINRPCLIKTPEFILRLIFGQMAEEIMIQGQKVLPQKALHHGFRFVYPTLEKSLEKIFR